MTIKRVHQKQLVVGKWYWLVLKGNDFQKVVFDKQFLFKGFRYRKPCFTRIDWGYSMTYYAPASKFVYYEEV